MEEGQPQNIGENTPYFTISELSKAIKVTVEGAFEFVRVRAEISRPTRAASGHLYFTLKDGDCELRSAMFRRYNSQLNFNPTNGLEVKVFGSVTFYEKKGQAQLVVSKMEPDGQGSFFKAFEELKKTLRDKGFFDTIHKKAVPKFPRSIGLVTSESGAAIKDILSIMNRRAPHVEIIIRSVSVQGRNSAEDISEAILDFNNYALVDVIILGRGGGSIEDLWAFNEKIVAEAIFSSSIPIISAVGHDTDFTISDFTADLRAPTPSAAAELVSESIRNMLINLDNYNFTMLNFVNKIIERTSFILDSLDNRLIVQKPESKISRQIKKFSQHKKSLIDSIYFKLKSLDEGQNSLKKQLLALGPINVLKRGYSIASNKSGKIIHKSKNLKVGEIFSLKMSDGNLKAEKISEIKN